MKPTSCSQPWIRCCAGCIRDVREVLSEIGADDIPQIQVFNKIDQPADTEPHLERDAKGRIARV